MEKAKVCYLFLTRYIVPGMYVNRLYTFRIIYYFDKCFVVSQVYEDSLWYVTCHKNRMMSGEMLCIEKDHLLDYVN